VITDKQVEAVRARLCHEVENFLRLYERFSPIELAEYRMLVVAAMRLLLDARCAQGGTRAEVIDVVRDVRAKDRWRADNIEPVFAERLIGKVLSADAPALVDYDVAGGRSWLLFHALAADAEIRQDEVIDLLASARRLADEWMAKRPLPHKPRKGWLPWRR
jgi:hypothetical protein